ncbi:MAG: TRAP transporter small permease [Deltaproteobacteria bacterium]|nr:TRAP transporter small permease [Deltaproteobacteria bacterium]
MKLSEHFLKIEQVVNAIGRILNYGGVAFLFVLMLLVVVHVIGRYFFSLPILGSVELIEFLMVLVVFLGLAECASKRGNVAVEILVDLMPKRVQVVIDTVTSFLSVIIVSLITWQSVIQVTSFLESGHVSGVHHIPYYPFAILMVLGWAAFDLVLIVHFFGFLGRALRK